ncbi:S-adenosyl-L-methionine-dependent methyltransferase [Sodiomyces alkalinus F11]|uniref:S-adenosyl-L-methionine-dependent methyltransferase n=1 Tax=Sodiomyces alkalinus (strain CBS 110278 / VKM F-3762 / F11) TaxID=1314773 RepID=A0A3N2Q8G1_SODAK|nr:S-adenosyl-L-methionine-dependent methyltransferase [Sodiomyces alkalinus F11]ROT43059.1 S-adenosyl-L-methionine-dependent methyltransferase [Sodiomyces alkalinus F11]
MATFSRSTFSAASYAAFRPSYPPPLFRSILKRTRARGATASSPSGTLLDLGCGHGLIARALSPHFDRVLAIDPSPVMVRQAVSATPDNPKIAFRQGQAEDLSFLADGTVDLAVAGQAAHWFDYSRAWPELARVVRSGGALAFWGYKDNILVGRPRANAVFDAACYGEDDVAAGFQSMARYWEQPGRDILRDSLRAVVPPAEHWGDVRRIVYDPDRETSGVGVQDGEAAWLRKRLKLGEFEGYLRTFSAFRAWRDAHPEVRSREEGGQGDIVDVLFDRILEVEADWKAEGEKWRDVEVDSVWGTALILATRK